VEGSSPECIKVRIEDTTGVLEPSMYGKGITPELVGRLHVYMLLRAERKEGDRKNKKPRSQREL
jgi:hypothetical protein